MAATSSALPYPTHYTDAGSYLAPGVGTGTEAGASGDSSKNSMSISTGGLIAIIVVVVVVTIMGISTATLFFIAKKREWKVRETLRRSARKVAAALTPRRSEFPASVKGNATSSRHGRPTKFSSKETMLRSSSEDVEKGMPRKEPWAKGRR
ncbi:hypothetical protein K4F52_005033 [Lecanicillium sp. MT-2017a]|nr:hypothetical protein K4F52_005033 [Lecanicillium sp. MT-2017a]